MTTPKERLLERLRMLNDGAPVYFLSTEAGLIYGCMVCYERKFLAFFRVDPAKRLNCRSHLSAGYINVVIHRPICPFCSGRAVRSQSYAPSAEDEPWVRSLYEQNNEANRRRAAQLVARASMDRFRKDK